MRAKSCRVGTRATISAILSRKFQLWRTFSWRFFFTCRFTSSRVVYTCDFSSHAGNTTKFEKMASPAWAKNRSCSRGLMHCSKSLILPFFLPAGFCPCLLLVIWIVYYLQQKQQHINSFLTGLPTTNGIFLSNISVYAHFTTLQSRVLLE